MLLRTPFGILVFAALLAPASASLVTYRVTGTFDQATEDYAPLLNTEFTYDFTYDTATPNAGDESAAAYELASTNLKTAMGSLATVAGQEGGFGAAVVDLDPEIGSVAFGGYVTDEALNQQTFGLVFPDLEPQTGAFPNDLVAFAGAHKGTFFITGYGPAAFAGAGTASASLVGVQAVPEPASIAAVAVGALAALRRRRRQAA